MNVSVVMSLIPIDLKVITVGNFHIEIENVFSHMCSHKEQQIHLSLNCTLIINNYWMMFL